MAKNISNNQWFKDIADNVYLNTAVINNILFITVIHLNAIKANTTIATLRNPELFQTTYSGAITNYNGASIRVIDGKLIVSTELSNSIIANTMLVLKSKQLETDFYSPEQLAEMYPDDPAYHSVTYELTDETKPVVDPVEDMGVT